MERSCGTLGMTTSGSVGLDLQNDQCIVIFIALELEILFESEKGCIRDVDPGSTKSACSQH